MTQGYVDKALLLSLNNGDDSAAIKLLQSGAVDLGQNNNSILRRAVKENKRHLVEWLVACRKEALEWKANTRGKEDEQDPTEGLDYLGIQNVASLASEATILDPNQEEVSLESAFQQLSPENGEWTHPGLRIDLAVDDNVCIRTACRKGFVEVVKSLLSSPEVDPSAKSNEAICVACWNNHQETVARLLECPSVDPCVNGNFPIRCAMLKKHKSIVIMLAKSDKMDENEAERFIETLELQKHKHPRWATNKILAKIKGYIWRLRFWKADHSYQSYSKAHKKESPNARGSASRG